MKKRSVPLHRTILAACLLAVVMGGVVYAVLFSNSAVVDGNTISTSSANLKVSTDGVNYATRVAGFDFSNIMPGPQPQPIEGKTIHLRNDGSTRLSLNLMASSLDSDSVTNIDISQVQLVLTRGTTTDMQQYPLSSLTAAGTTPLNYQLDPGQEVLYRLQVLIGDEAVADTTVQSVINGLTLLFDGAAENT